MTVYLAWIGECEPSLHGVFSDYETALMSATLESNRDFAKMLDSAANISDWWKERGPDPVDVKEYEVHHQNIVRIE